MPDLVLKHIGRRGEEHYDVLADGTVVGRIMMLLIRPPANRGCGLSPTNSRAAQNSRGSGARIETADGQGRAGPRRRGRKRD
jgi:hypothetical protein